MRNTTHSQTKEEGRDTQDSNVCTELYLAQNNAPKKPKAAPEALGISLVPNA